MGALICQSLLMEGVAILNTLAYGLLSLLTNETYSGYDLTQRIQPFWPAKHSQIYPLLSCLEQEGYVRYELIKQNDKPDKKMYAITDAGKEKLREWLAVPPAEPALRDELLFKAFCLGSIVSPQEGRQLFEDRAAYCRSKLDYLDQKKKAIQQSAEWPSTTPVLNSPMFGIYILLDKGYRRFEAELEWCEDVLAMLEG
ncbi:transcriptional regulator, PadR-like family [Paenibacillus curdlanolyticus YK9]|uniref:Transcriptional regulator, PadR-like family n=1 Tax=Paenibacillus curdlanolyticus YK9 TaxID=717606 RepID=E0I7M5_9BACL|nr:transcriptional regulator, PadR-like family [Paenibacillus curdlanolyticus YK9]